MDAESRPSSAPFRSRADTMPADTLRACARTGRLQFVLDDRARSTTCNNGSMHLGLPVGAPHLLLRCSGLPRAMTHSPTRSAEDSPSLATGSRPAALMRSTARSDCLQGLQLQGFRR